MRREYWTETTECSTETTAFVFETTTAAVFPRVLRRRRRRARAFARRRRRRARPRRRAPPRKVRGAVPGRRALLDRAHREHRLADTGRGAAAGNDARGNAMDASAAETRAADRPRTTSRAAPGAPRTSAFSSSGGNSRFRFARDAIAARRLPPRLVSEKTEKEKHSPAFSPLRDMRAGIGDALQYAAQVFYARCRTKPTANSRRRRWRSPSPRTSRSPRRAGSPGVRRRRGGSPRRCFVASPSPAPTDAASLLGLVAAVMPEGEARALALRRAEEIRRGRVERAAGAGAFAGAEKARSAVDRRTLAATASRKFMENENSSKTVGKGFASPLGVSDASSTRPAERARGARRSARAPWRSARGTTVRGARRRRGGRRAAGEARAPRTCACSARGVLARLADAHLGRWESAAASARPSRTTASATARSARGCWRCVWRRRPPRRSTPAAAVRGATRFIATPSSRRSTLVAARCLPLRRLGTKTTKSRMSSSASSSSFDTIAEDKPLRTPRPATRKTPRAAVSRRTATVSSPAAAISRAYVCCRAFAAQALWSAGERAEAIVMLSQVCGDQLTRIRAPAHCLLPAAALARRNAGGHGSLPRRRLREENRERGCFWRRTRFSNALPRRPTSSRYGYAARVRGKRAPAGTCEKEEDENSCISRLHSRVATDARRRAF